MTTLLASLSAFIATFLVVRQVTGTLAVAGGTSGVKQKANAVYASAVSRIGQRVPSRYRQNTDKKIQMAGGLGGLSAEQFLTASVAAVCFGLMIAVFFMLLGAPLLGLFVLLIAAILPPAWLRDRVAKRHNAILRQMPYHLDLLTLGVEAGLDFSAALAKMVEKAKPGPLREEFNYMLSEVRVGTARSVALKAMSERINLPAMTSFLSALLQADKLGMSVGKVLRIQSETVRVERSQRAEKRANEAPVKILIPLILFIFPTIWVILSGPLIFQWLF